MMIVVIILILIQKVFVLNCSNIHQIFTNKLEFQENDAYQTNILYKIKKVHNPYKYLKKNYPQIKDEKIYDFIFRINSNNSRFL